MHPLNLKKPSIPRSGHVPKEDGWTHLAWRHNINATAEDENHDYYYSFSSLHAALYYLIQSLK